MRIYFLVTSLCLKDQAYNCLIHFYKRDCYDVKWQNEDDLENENYLRNEDALKNEDDLFCLYSVSLGDALTTAAIRPFLVAKLQCTMGQIEVSEGTK